MKAILLFLILVPGLCFGQITDNWDAVKVGETDISKIYVGEDLVWSGSIDAPSADATSASTVATPDSNTVIPLTFGLLYEAEIATNYFYNSSNLTVDNIIITDFSETETGTIKYDGSNIAIGDTIDFVDANRITGLKSETPSETLYFVLKFKVLFDNYTDYTVELTRNYQLNDLE